MSAYVFGEYYWFSCALMLMFLIAPLLWKTNNKLLLAIFSSVLLINIVNGFTSFLPSVGVFQSSRAFAHFTWFVLGYALKRFDAQKILANKQLKHILFALSVSASSLSIIFYETGIMSSYVGKFIVSLALSYILLYIFSFVKIEISILTLMSKYSYQIFLMDSFVKVVLFALVDKFLPINLPVMLIISILNITICLCICSVVNKIKYVRTLIGLS